MHERNKQLRERHLQLLDKAGRIGTRMRLPIVNMNGTQAWCLVEKLIKVKDAFNELHNALSAAWPHDRDFQVNPNVGEGQLTRGAWQERRDLLDAMRKEFEAYAMGINDQRR